MGKGRRRGSLACPRTRIMGVTSPTLFSTGERVYLDSAVFIYYVENRVPYADALKPFFEAIEHERVDAYTSTVTVAEILTVPKREKKNALVKAFRTFLTEFVTVYRSTLKLPMPPQRCAQIIPRSTF